MSTGAETSDAEAACAMEPIHIPGSHQPHGAVLALASVRALTIVAAGRNAARFLGVPAFEAGIIGRSLADILGAGFADVAWSRFQGGGLRGEAPWQSTLRPDGRSPAYDVAVHEQAGLILVELEPAAVGGDTDAQLALRQLQDIVADVRSAGGDVERLASAAVRGLRRLLGYERMLIYRFDSDWNGQAIAEDKDADWDESLSGLRFPATDIPTQARELYRRSPMRWVADRDATPTPIDGGPAWAGDRTIDLSFASLRSLSPVHLQIHRSLDIDGSMSLSVVFDGRLWGLVVGHHRKPHMVPSHRRLAAIALTDAFALRVGPAPHFGTEQARRDDLGRLTALLAYMAQADDVAASLTTGPVTVASLFAATGAAVIHGGKVSALGSTPPEADLREFAAWLRARHAGAKQFHTSNVTSVHPAWARHADVASGVLAVFLSADGSDMLLWFRAEEPQLVSWGSGSHMKTPLAAVTTPRPPFERWEGMRRGFARPWAEYELEMAETLRHSITEVMVRSLRRIADLNDRLRQSQKMEAVGQLTGGIAHDFNNLLAGITGSLELMQSCLVQGRIADLRRYIGTATTSANRAASLVHGLLAFSRRQTLDPRVVDVARLAASLEDLIRRTVGPGINVEAVISDGLWKTICDANQLEAAVLNLAINARDAMPAGGRLTIEVSNARLDDGDVSCHGEVAAGQYVAVSVTDTGVGMPPDVMARVFEPFFTTKPLGQGTGLGLSMVYGFAKQSDGQACVDSEVGRGTTVRLYLPRAYETNDLAAGDDGKEPDDVAPAGETVLVVDDEPIVRMVIGDTLRDLGYGVIEAANGAEGLRMLQSSHVDILVSDVGLPGGMDGRQFADAARANRPGLRVLFVTGYAKNAIVSNGTLGPGMELLTKPFTIAELTAKMRRLM